MIKDKKGITLVSLIITIVLMIIISSTTVTISMDRFEINKFNKMITDIELLVDKVSNYYLKYGVLPILRNSTDNTAITYPKSELDFVNMDTNYYILDLEAMEGISLNYGKSGFNYWKNYAQNITNSNSETKLDVYIIGEATHNVYYVKGMELDGTLYHYAKADNGVEDIVPPSTPQIKLVSGTQNSKGIYTTEVELEIVPGKEDGMVAKETEISTDNGGTWTNINTLANNIYKITTTGEHSVQVRSYDKNDNISENSMELSVEIKQRKTLTAYSENKSWLGLPKSFEGTVSKFRIYGKSEEVQQLLPSQYQQVEYIESTGTQYIDTGVSLSNNIEIISQFASTDITQNRCYVFGVYGNSSTRIQFSYSSPSFVGWYNRYDNQTSYFSVDTNKHTIQVSKGKFILDDNVICNLTDGTFSSNYNIFMFALNGEGVISNISKMKLYSTKIYNNGILVRDFIPCYRKSDNVIGLYDLVNGVFYTNAGTGTFLKGEATIGVGDLVTDTTDVNYGKYKIPVKTSGKNLFDGKIEIGRIDPDTGEDSSFGYQEYYRSINFIEIDSSIENIVFSSNTNARRIHLCCYDENYSYLGRRYHTLNIDGDRTFYSISLLNDTKYIRFSITTYNNPAIIENVPIQVEYGDIKTEYEPYVENITNIYLNEPLRKVGDYADYIDFENNKVVYYQLATPKEETIELPELTTFNEYTKIEVLTEVTPSKIEAEYDVYEIK